MEVYVIKNPTCFSRWSVSFPCPKRDILIKIRNSEYSKKYIEQWIYDEIVRILEIPNNLPEANVEYWDSWLLDVYMHRAYCASSSYLGLD